MELFWRTLLLQFLIIIIASFVLNTDATIWRKTLNKLHVWNTRRHPGHVRVTTDKEKRDALHQMYGNFDFCSKVNRFVPDILATMLHSEPFARQLYPVAGQIVNPEPLNDLVAFLHPVCQLCGDLCLRENKTLQPVLTFDMFFDEASRFVPDQQVEVSTASVHYTDVFKFLVKDILGLKGVRAQSALHRGSQASFNYAVLADRVEDMFEQFNNNKGQQTSKFMERHQIFVLAWLVVVMQLWDPRAVMHDPQQDDMLICCQSSCSWLSSVNRTTIGWISLAVLAGGLAWFGLTKIRKTTTTKTTESSSTAVKGIVSSTSIGTTTAGLDGPQLHSDTYRRLVLVLVVLFIILALVIVFGHYYRRGESSASEHQKRYSRKNRVKRHRRRRRVVKTKRTSI